MTHEFVVAVSKARTYRTVQYPSFSSPLLSPRFSLTLSGKGWVVILDYTSWSRSCAVTSSIDVTSDGVVGTHHQRLPPPIDLRHLASALAFDRVEGGKKEKNYLNIKFHLIHLMYK